MLPFDDIFTFYLRIRRRPDGTLGAFLVNPDRSYGAAVDRLVYAGHAVTLLTGEREFARGTYDADSDVIALYFPARGGSYDFRLDDDQSAFYPRGKSPDRYVYAPPLARDDGWPTGTVEDAGIDRRAVEEFIQAIIDMPMDLGETPQVHGILIARYGRLVLEEYFHGEHRDKLHETRSASKSLTATIVGAVLQAGAPLKLSTPVYEIMNAGTFPADLDPRKRAMTLEHLLTMTSGYFCDDANPDAPGDENVMWEQAEEPDYYRYTLKVPMATAPGDTVIYCSANANLALGIVARASGESPLVTFDRLLGAPMQITAMDGCWIRRGTRMAAAACNFCRVTS